MTAMPAARLIVPKGHSRPRIAPPRPVRSDLAGYREAAECMGISLIPWQETAAVYLEALDTDGRHLYREVPIIVARQNGKTEELLPLIHKRITAGRRMMHTAQDRYLPREIFSRVADHFWSEHRDLFPTRNDRPTRPRYANGQEEIRLTTGGFYRIFAPTASGARGESAHDLILDEIRELDSWDVINAAKPTLSLEDWQIIYLSNMGDESSVVLNALRKRRDSDPTLAFLEWSTAPEYAADDPRGWAQSNPMMGHEPPGLGSVYERLTTAHRAAELDGTLNYFETEHLCRYVPTLLPSLVAEGAWDRLRGPLRPGARKFLAVSVDPKSRRASAAVAWPQPDDVIAVRVIADVTGAPVDLDAFGPELAEAIAGKGIIRSTYDDRTDRELARHLRGAKPMVGAEFWHAAEYFVKKVETRKLRWQDADVVAEDLRWTARKENDLGTYSVMRSDDDHTNTALLAVIRAVWLASGALRATKPRIH